MSDNILTDPIVLDETGQLMLDKLDAIISALNPNAQGVSFDKTGCDIITATNVQGALKQLDSGLNNTNQSLTQLETFEDLTSAVEFASGVTVNSQYTYFYRLGKIVYFNVFFTSSTNGTVATIKLPTNGGFSAYNDKQYWFLMGASNGGSSYQRLSIKGSSSSNTTIEVVGNAPTNSYVSGAIPIK